MLLAVITSCFFENAKILTPGTETCKQVEVKFGTFDYICKKTPYVKFCRNSFMCIRGFFGCWHLGALLASMCYIYLHVTLLTLLNYI